MLGYDNEVVNPDVWRVVNHDSVSVGLWGHDTVVQELEVDRDKEKRLIRYWYWVDGEFTANPYRAKLLFARSKLLGGIQGAAVIAVGCPIGTDVEAARADLDDFLAHVPPVDGSAPRRRYRFQKTKGGRRRAKVSGLETSRCAE